MMRPRHAFQLVISVFVPLVWSATWLVAQGNPVGLMDGTRVGLQFRSLVCSETSRVGDPVDFVVISDVLAGGRVVIRGATVVSGTVAEAVPARFAPWWRGSGMTAGRLGVSIPYATSVDGQVVRLRPTPAGSTPVHPRELLINSPGAFFRWAHRGERVDMLVDGDYTIQ